MPFYKTNKLFLLTFFWINFAFSQNYPVKHYSSANELPNNSVRALLVDSNNTLWIGTDNGVVKKENERFRYFFEEDGLALNSCWAIAEDKKGRLWFGSYGGGLSIYDGFRFRIISEEDGLVHNEITQLFSHGDYIYVGTSDGVSIINIDTFEIFSDKAPSEKELFRVQDFFKYEGEIYTVTYNSGIFKIEQNRGLSLVKLNDRKFLYSAFVENDSIYSSHKNYFTKIAVDEYLSPKDSVVAEKRGSSIIWECVKTKDGQLFAAAWGIYDTNGGIFEIGNSQISRALESSIPSKEVISLAYKPKFGRLYAGTRNAGLFEIALNPQIKFHELEDRELIGFAGTKNSSASLFKDGLLIETKAENHQVTLNQLKKWQKKYVQTTRLPLPKHADDFYELDYSTKAADVRFYDLKVFRGTYWLNTTIGLFAINESGELSQYLPLHSEEINFSPEGKLIETNPYGGLRIYSDTEALEYKHYSQEEPDTPTMVVGSLQQGQKTYFLSVFSGLYVLQNNKFTSYLKEGIWKEKKLRHITPLEQNMAISSEFGDIFIINDSEKFQILKKIPRAKIRGNTIAFLENYKGSLIIGTEKGLTIYRNDRYIFLDREQGLEQPLLSARVDKNILKIGSSGGFYTVDLDAVGKTEGLVERIDLKELVVNNENYSLENLEEEEQVELAHNQNSLLLRFSTNAHPYPKKLQYQYRLNKKANWSIPVSEPQIFLPALPPGRYDIDVKILDESTGLSHSGALLDLAILPPFWKTWWFFLLLGSSLGLLVFMIYRYQLGQAQKFEEQKGLIQKRFEETKMEALLAQMNPHFIFNAMNSIQYYIMNSDIDRASSFLNDFARLIRLNLDHCTKPKILLSEEIEYLQSYVRVENTRFNNRIHVIFEIDPAIDSRELEIPTMILQTFVENVFVHAFPAGLENPTLKISFRLLSGKILECGIEDNGTGFSEQDSGRLHESKGVNLVKERLDLLGYEVVEALQITSQKARGTKVFLRLNV